ncbi:MAG: integrating conjugative element protein [Candidatus Competibacteraceae bacterium]
MLVISNSNYIISNSRTLPRCRPATINLFYEIGGADAFSLPPSTVASDRFQGALELGLTYSCGNFNPVKGIATQLQNTVQRLKTLAVNALTAAVSALPLYILQRANPGAYDLVQNLLIKAAGIINLASQSCEAMEYQIANGKDPYADWLNLAKSYSWKTPMGTAGWQSASTDVKTAQDTVEQRGGKAGVPWTGGQRAGGLSQRPIQVLGDTGVAGYNLLLNRPAADTSAPGAAVAQQQRLVQLWNTPADLRAWINDVLGELTVKTEGIAEGQAGGGLLKQVYRETQTVQAALAALVKGHPADWTPATLATVAVGGTGVTPPVLTALQGMAPIERELLVNRLAGEVALARVVEQALQARRALLAGRYEPNIAGSPAVRQDGVLDKAVATLNREIDDLLFEKRARQELVSATASAILQWDRTRQGAGGTPAQDTHPVVNGAVLTP